MDALTQLDELRQKDQLTYTDDVVMEGPEHAPSFSGRITIHYGSSLQFSPILPAERSFARKQHLRQHLAELALVVYRDAVAATGIILSPSEILLDEGAVLAARWKTQTLNVACFAPEAVYRSGKYMFRMVCA